MNDRRMNDLVRMAVEVDELEREASAAPHLRLVGAAAHDAHPVPTRAWWIGMTAAAAAILAMAAALPLMLSPALPSGTAIVENTEPVGPVVPVVEPRDIAQGPVVAPVPVVDAGSIEKCVVMAIYRNDRGGVNCVTVPTPQVWQGNKCLSEVSAQELKTLSIDRPCPKDSDHALVVAMAGPQRSLPKTESDAVGLATCILRVKGEGLGRITSAAQGCVSPEVAVKIEAVGAH